MHKETGRGSTVRAFKRHITLNSKPHIWRAPVLFDNDGNIVCGFVCATSSPEHVLRFASGSTPADAYAKWASDSYAKWMHPRER